MMNDESRSIGYFFNGVRTVSGWLVTMVVVLAVFVAASCGSGDDETEQLATATDLADTWVRAWNEHDPELMGSVFSDDSVYDDSAVFDEPSGSNTYTRDEAMQLVTTGTGQMVTDVRRVGDLTPNEDGTFSFGIEWEFPGDEQRSGVIAMELEGDLASRIEVVSSEIIES